MSNNSDVSDLVEVIRERKERKALNDLEQVVICKKDKLKKDLKEAIKNIKESKDYSDLVYDLEIMGIYKQFIYEMEQLPSIFSTAQEVTFEGSLYTVLRQIGIDGL